MSACQSYSVRIDYPDTAVSRQARDRTDRWVEPPEGFTGENKETSTEDEREKLKRAETLR